MLFAEIPFLCPAIPVAGDTQTEAGGFDVEHLVSAAVKNRDNVSHVFGGERKIGHFAAIISRAAPMIASENATSLKCASTVMTGMFAGITLLSYSANGAGWLVS